MLKGVGSTKVKEVGVVSADAQTLAEGQGFASQVQWNVLGAAQKLPRIILLCVC